MITLTLPASAQARAVKDALDTYTRLAIGQIDVVTQLVRFGAIPVGGKQGERQVASVEQIERVEALVNEIKAVLGYSVGGSNGIGHRHVDASGHRAYEAMKALAKAIAIEANPNPGFRGVDYDGITVRYTADPEPVATAAAPAAGELEALRAFARDVMGAWPAGGLDGGDLQAFAEKHGLLRPEIRHAPCGEGCGCAEYADTREFEGGVTCYRKTSLLLGASRGVENLQQEDGQKNV